MIRIGRLIKINCMAVGAKHGGTSISVGVAALAIYRSMCTSKWEVGSIEIKGTIRRSNWMTSQTSITIIVVSGNTIMLRIGLVFVVIMTLGTAEDSESTSSGMTLDALGPDTLMFATVDGKVLTIVIKG